MRVTVLGSCGAWPEAGRSCSGYLFESGSTRVVVDLGYGTLPRLLSVCPAETVTAVVVSHAHADHCVDLHGLSRARSLPEPPLPPLPVYALPDVVERLSALDGIEGPARWKSVADLHPLAPDRSFDLGPFRFRPIELPHFVRNFGFRIEVDGAVAAYTGDTGPSPKIVELARDADLFLCQATHQGPPRGPEPRFLLTAAEAGEYATQARARRLLLTHVWPGDDRRRSVTEAAGAYAGPIVVADEGLALDVP
jgi:ribonuclease BN (tRNA processing enzyme)